MANLITGRLTTIIDADNSGLLAKIKQSKAQLKQLANLKTPTLGLDNKLFTKKVRESIKAFSKLRSKNISLNAKNTSLAKITQVSKGLKGLKGKTILIKVNIGSSAAKISKIKKLLTSLKGKTIPLNVTTGSSAAKIKKATKDVQNLGKSSKKTTKDVAALGKQGDKTGSSLSGMTKGIIFTSIVAGATLLTKKILALTIAAERTEIAFQSLLASNAGGSQLFDDIINLAKVTPFTSTKLNKAAKIMLSYGIAGDKIIPTLRMVGDVSAATGAQIDNLALAFGQIASTGRLQGQDLRQLVNAGFNPLQVIAEKTGRSMSDLKDDMVKGLIPFSQVNQAFKDVTSSGGRFFGMMVLQSRTVGGRLSTLKDTLEQIGRNLGEMAQGGLKLVVEQLIKAAEAFEAVTSGKGTPGQKAAVGAVGGTAAAGLGAAGTVGAVAAGTALTKILGVAFENSGQIIENGANHMRKRWLAARLTPEFRKKFGRLSGSPLPRNRPYPKHIQKFIDSRRKARVPLIAGSSPVGSHTASGRTGPAPIILSSRAKAKATAKGLARQRKGSAPVRTAAVFKSFSTQIKAMGAALRSLHLITAIKGLRTLVPLTGKVGLILAPIIAAIGAVVVSIGYFIKQILELNKAADAGVTLWDSFKGSIVNLSNVIIGMVKAWTTPFLNIGKNLIFVAIGVKKAFGEIFNRELPQGVKNWVNEVVDGLDVIKVEMIGIFETFSKDFKAVFGKLFDGFWARYTIDTVKGAVGKVGGEGGMLENFSVNVVNTFTGGKFKELLGPDGPQNFGGGEGFSSEKNKFAAENRKKQAAAALSRAAKTPEGIAAAEKAAAEKVEELRDSLIKAFSDVDLQIDISKGKKSLLKNKEEFMSIFPGLGDGIGEALNELGASFDFTTIEDILEKAPKELIPDFAALIEKLINEERQKVSDAFNNVSSEVDITGAKESILKSKEEFNKLLDKFADEEIFKGIKNIDELLKKVPKELLPDLEGVLNKLLDAEHQKILNLFSEVSDEKDIETTKSDILKNKVFYEPLLAEFGFDNFQDAFLKIPGKLLPAFKNVLEKLAPNFSARLGQVRKNLNVFNAKRKIAERLKEGKFNDNLDIPNQEIAKVLKAFVKSTPEENLPDVLSLINEFFPKAPKEDDNKNKNRLAGAVMKGSVAAHGVLLARQEAGTEKKIENNTALAVEVLRQIKEGGISLKNVAVAN